MRDDASEPIYRVLAKLPTGLVIDLDVHRAEYADKYVKAHQVYVLVEKHVQAPEDELDGGGGDVTRSSTPSSIVSSATRTRERTKTRYSCLLRKVESLLPDYKLRRANEKKKETVRASSRTGEEETGAPSSGRRGRRPPSFKTVAHLAASRKTKSRNTSAK